jgi:hypothetical protein
MACRNGVCVCVCVFGGGGEGSVYWVPKRKNTLQNMVFFSNFVIQKIWQTFATKKNSNISWIHTKEKPKISNLLVEKKIVDPKRKKDKQIQWLQHKS